MLAAGSNIIRTVFDDQSFLNENSFLIRSNDSRCTVNKICNRLLVIGCKNVAQGKLQNVTRNKQQSRQVQAQP